MFLSAMKKMMFFILLPLFITLPLCIFSQNYVSGLGVFKLGESVKKLDSFALSNKVKFDTLTVSAALKTKNYKALNNIISFSTDKALRIFKTTENTDESLDSDEELVILPFVEIYKINHYEVAGITVMNLKLYYSGDLLYKIIFDGSTELDDAMRLKYGKPEIKEITKDVKCVYKLTGNEVIEQEQTFYQTWPTEKPNNCLLITGVYFDDKCKKNYIDSWRISNREIEKQNESLAKTAKENRDNERMKDKAKNLTDL